MKSTMKSAFAIIAVALMIMVAVVPMVGVVNGDTSQVYDPEEQHDKITMTFNLYEKDNKITSGDYTIKVTWGTSNSIVLTTTSGSVTKIFDETKMTGAKATVGTGTGSAFKADSNFEVYTIGNVAAGANLSFDLKKGYTQTNNITFDAKDNSTKVYNAVQDVGTTVYVNYDIYKNTGTEASPTYTRIGSASSTSLLGNDSQFKVTYPLTESEVYVKVNKVTVGTTDIAFTTGYFEVVGSSSVSTITADQFVFTITGVAGMPAGTIGSLAGTDGAETPKNITNISAVKNTISAASKATFIYKLDATTASSNITYTATFGSVSIAGLSGATISLANKAVFGAYDMGGAASSSVVYAQDGLNLSFTIKDNTGATTKSNTTTAYVAGGYYIAAVPTLTSGQTAAADDIIVPASTAYQITTTSVASSGSAAEVVAADSGTVGTTTYQLAYVSGTISNATAGYTFTLSGASKTFGLTNNKVVCVENESGAKFGFYTAINEYISFTAQSGSTFADNSSGRYYVPATGQTIALKLVDKIMSFLVTDGDGEELENGTLYIKVIDANGEPVGTTSTTNPITGVAYETLNDASLDVSKLKVYFSWTPSTYGLVNTFAAGSEATAVAYEETALGMMLVSSLEKTYYVFVKDAAGNIIAVQPTIQNATAYMAEDGTKIYTLGDTITPVLEADGSYSYRVSSALVDVTLSGVEKNVVILTVSDSNYVFQTAPYLATSTLTITAKADSITATIFKTDGVTPIANTMFELQKDDGTLIDVQTTDANGTITFTANAEIPSDAKIVASSAKIGDIKNIMGSTNVKAYGIPYSLFYASYDVYKIDITDADGKVFDGAESTDTLGIARLGESVVLAGSYAVDNDGVITVSLNADAGDVLTVTLAVNSGGKAVRTFDTYTLTADDVKNGTISLVSKEKTYTLSAVDADGNTIYICNHNRTMVKKEVAGVVSSLESASSTFVTTFKDVKSGAKDIAVEWIITSPGQNEEYVAQIVEEQNTNGPYGLPEGVYYAFDENNAAVAVSKNSTITFELVDATGAKISTVDTYTVKVNTSITATQIDGTNKYYFVGDATAANKVTVTDGSTYTFTAAQKIADGVVKAKEQTVVFTAVDAAGVPIVDDGFAIKKIAADGAITNLAERVKFEENGVYSKIMIVDSTVTYKLVDGDSVYTFTANGTKFTAAEQTVTFTFTYANGFAYDGTGSVTGITVYYNDGTTYTPESFATKQITIDTTNVASYKLTMDGKSFTGAGANLKTTVSKISGYVAYDYNTSTSKVIATYYDGTVVKKEVDVTVSSSGLYTITPDFVNDGYDKVIVQYYVKGILTSQATLTASTGYIASLVPVAETEETLLAKIIPSDGIEYQFAGGKVYLTAVDKYSSTVGSTDGKYVQTWKFEGWYVNGVKLTDDLNCAVDNVATNVITACYVLDDSKELGKESAAGVDPTVLAIGIVAVIIALIAVVYTVIQKKE